jgi:hypothetical protein
MGRLVAIGFIWLGCAVAWGVLGSTLVYRSGETSGELLDQVHKLWGPEQDQLPPHAVWRETHKIKDEVTTYDPAGRPQRTIVEKDQIFEYPITLAGSDIAVKLDLEQRRKGLLWFPTYDVAFRARYAFENHSGATRDVELSLPLGALDVAYDGFRVLADDGSAIDAHIQNGVASWTHTFTSGERREFGIAYKSRGTSSWSYGQRGVGLGGDAGRVRDFHLTLETNFADVDFPAGTLSPSAHHATEAGWTGNWSFESLVSGSAVGVTLPQLTNPGPLASRITFFAPVGLLFFFFVIAVLAAAQGRQIHPMNYFLFGCAFFAFHLLFAYLVDHLSIAASFALAAAASVALSVTYARLFVGWKFSLREIGLAQLVYLVLFSFTFLWQGFTGLAITLGAVLTLAVIMQITGRLNWSRLPGRDDKKATSLAAGAPTAG